MNDNEKIMAEAENEELKDFIIPVTWEVYSNVVVRGAKDLAEARKLVEDNLDDIPLAAEPEYIDGSYRIDADTDEDLEDAQGNTALGVIMEINRETGKHKYERL